MGTPTYEELFDMVDTISEYYPDLIPTDDDSYNDLLGKYFYWVDEYNDGYDSRNWPRPAWA